MSRPTWNTWDGGTGDGGYEAPRRPSVDDVGGDEKLDNDDAPPNAIEHFTSQGWNQKAKQVPALARVSCSCKLEVRFSGGTPFVNRSPGASINIQPSTFTVVDNGLGDTTVTWPADTFPVFECSPTGLTPLSALRALATVEEVTNGIRVRSWTLDASGNATAADVAWTLELN